jgi:hypothetical protein
MTDGQVGFCLLLCFALGFLGTWLMGSNGIP